MFKWIFFVSLLAGCIGLSAQSTGFTSPYTLSWKLDAPLVGGGLSLNTLYFILDRKNKPLSEQQIAALDRQHISTFDRSASFNWSPPVAHASDGVMLGSMAAPGLLLISPEIRKDWDKLGIIYVETLFLTAGLTNMTKVLVKRSRPYTYNPNAPLELKLERDARYSFFSGHTSITASMTFMTAKIYQDYHPGSKALPYIWTAAAIVPATIGFLRWRAGKHFWTDVLVGYLVGAATGFIVPHLHTIIR